MNSDSILVSTKQTNKMMRNCTISCKEWWVFSSFTKLLHDMYMDSGHCQIFSKKMVSSKFYKDFREKWEKVSIWKFWDESLGVDFDEIMIELGHLNSEELLEIDSAQETLTTSEAPCPRK